MGKDLQLILLLLNLLACLFVKTTYLLLAAIHSIWNLIDVIVWYRCLEQSRVEAVITGIRCRLHSKPKHRDRESCRRMSESIHTVVGVDEEATRKRSLGPSNEIKRKNSDFLCFALLCFYFLLFLLLLDLHPLMLMLMLMLLPGFLLARKIDAFGFSHE